MYMNAIVIMETPKNRKNRHRKNNGRSIIFFFFCKRVFDHRRKHFLNLLLFVTERGKDTIVLRVVQDGTDQSGLREGFADVAFIL
jgi:hypothetical protein